MDGWALLRTWSPTTTIGYEIKVSRSDWLRDQKVGEYQKRVNLMYVVAPKGIVQAGELPVGCGLLEVPEVGRRLLTRVKAVRHEPADDRLLLFYVLMCRSRVVADANEASREGVGLAFWRGVAEKRVERHIIGRLASKRVGEALRAATCEAQAANAERARWLPAMTALAEILGQPLDLIRQHYSHDLVRMLRARVGRDVPTEVHDALGYARQALQVVERCTRELRDALTRAQDCPAVQGSPTASEREAV